MHTDGFFRCIVYQSCNWRLTKFETRLLPTTMSSSPRPSEDGEEPVSSRTSPIRPLLDLSGAAIQGSREDKNPSIVLPNQSEEISHFAVDLGGSLIKLVYFSRRADRETTNSGNRALSPVRKLDHLKRGGFEAELRRYGGFPILGGRLHFVKFETSKVNDCLDFIQSKRLHLCKAGGAKDGVIKATGGGAFKFADMFKERLGATIDKEDEMGCLVAGANFLLRAIRDEAFTHLEGEKKFVQIDHNDLYPYLLVNIGSGVSMIKVDGDGQYERVSGTNVGGGTFWGLGRLLTKSKSFDELLEISQGGDNSAIDMLVGDIYGGLDYSKIGLSASTIASSFGKVIGQDKPLSEYRREDIALSLLRMISYNIGQVAYLNALRYGLKRIFFGGFFIRGHAYTMDTMSFAIRYWSKGEAQAMFLRHEGFLGALGAFLNYDKHGLSNLTAHQCVERFPMGAPYARGEVYGPPIRDLNGKITWMDKFVSKGNEITAPVPTSYPGTTGLGGFERPLARSCSLRSDASAALNVGVLHLVPSLEPFPLLADIQSYEPNTVDLSDQSEREYWLKILSSNLSDLVEKAVASEGGTPDVIRRGDAFARAFKAHLARLREEPAAYGQLGLANLLEMREECLREFHFQDVYLAIKQRENEASMVVLPDLLAELDSLEPSARLLALIEGVLAANIFDWGSRACVELYRSGTILEIYRMSRNKMRRPWRVDDFDSFCDRMRVNEITGIPLKPHKRALLFVDNSGADIVLGMIPLARELLMRGTEVVLVANSLPTINDVTAVELPSIIAAAAKHCEILRKAATAGGLLVDVVDDDLTEKDQAEVPFLTVVENGCGSPCIDFRQVSSELASLADDTDLVVLEGMGRALHTNFNAKFKCDVLKLAMVKNQRLAEQIINGSIYDCVCRFEPKEQS
ncbi:pantothenate kinase 2 isoform X2 [Physcomitrium patens]|uniref:Pantothenate kinase 2 n=1 Tax=Physcomitrium patens TaxID=3218 RepID=A0A2K1K343_PHYPA|nr:pantothenate kinase 2-like isoform X2 [Physcomitrium patens]XP_024385144.1 pantothenate kinase 2-like isoform X2 [Physcomitrium patens]XP_024385146.1 pantothenate kinase 2-like isoform X2 [Physcomitrium patens]XP_024385147.1 pantothenate kinase 2-like isoform X2 [Physcomitrium patens]XP_024385148.1 pantothenate kinase 2-like isoform X2 [Physcomitrium patens]XP_024385149.1 pantothenate kinase 2-like isoform X2 [Physcomitrium patens]XP_024385150.1 pantothenate kinase 2-like isoform X2 [Physc|eukprot:XP_024385143.1 pantothenate kinase 2-like isoform X2 [Physcomitrella patens]